MESVLALGLIFVCAIIVIAAYALRWKLAYDEEKLDLEAELTEARARKDLDAEESIQRRRLELSLYGPIVLRKGVHR